MNARRLYGPVVLGTLAVGGLAFLAASRPWARVKLSTEGLPPDTVKVTGSDAYPLVTALALVVITASLAVLASSGRIRVAVGVLTALVSAAAIGILLLDGGSLDSSFRSAVKASPAFTSGDVDPVSASAWKYVAVAAFVLAAVLGVVTARFARTWPAMSSRYDAPSARPKVAAIESESDMWKALDDGRDPTQ